MNSLAWSSMKAWGVVLVDPFNHREVSGLGVGGKGITRGQWMRVVGKQSLDARTEVGPKHLWIRELFLGDRSKTFLKALRNIQHVKFNCLFQKSTCQTQILVIKKTPTILTSVHHSPPTLIPDGLLRVVRSTCMTPHFTPKKREEGRFLW